MVERLKAPVLKTGIRLTVDRGFESHPLRHLPLRRVKNHHRAFPYGKLPAALQAVRESTASPSVKLGFEMLTLTACRSGEVRGMTWDEVNLQETTWTVPATQ